MKPGCSCPRRGRRRVRSRERRFERAQPNQLWQSDIFTFLLRRHERIYVTVFLDDHSRFVVSHAMAHHQKSTLVLEAFERGVAAYGCPQEVLTDQGRQYTAWRGVTEFEQTLKRYGVAHVKSRPQHPADAREGGALLEDAVDGVSLADRLRRLRRLPAAFRALRPRL